MLAFATRAASFLVASFCFGGGAFFCPSAGIKGSTGVATFAARSTGCVLIGPVTGLLLGISDNSIRPTLFNDPMKSLPSQPGGLSMLFSRYELPGPRSFIDIARHKRRHSESDALISEIGPPSAPAAARRLDHVGKPGNPGAYRDR
jgi:hypothetical protein